VSRETCRTPAAPGVLAAAELLDGRPATTHWAYWRLLEKLGAHYVPEQRWVEDGKFITAAG
jgi:transcriptional regulator GlxA family with amidase domain